MGEFTADILSFPGPTGAPSPTQPAAPAGGVQTGAANDQGFGADIAAMGQATAQDAKGAVIWAQDANPDAAGRAATLAPKFGQPPAIVESQLPEYEKQHQIGQSATVIDQNPKIADWVANDPFNARVAKDDFDHLGTLAKGWAAFYGGWTEGGLENQRGRLGSAQGLGEQNASQVADVDRRIAANPQLSGIYGALQKLGGFGGGILDNFIRGGIGGAEVGGLVGAGVGASAIGAGAVPGAVAGSGIGFAAGTAADMGKVAAGNAYLDMSKIQGHDGQPLSEPVKATAAVLVGLGTAALGMVGVKGVGGAASDAAGKFLGDAMKEAITRPTVARAVGQFATSLGKAGLTGAALNTAMQGTSIFGEEFAKQLDGGQNFDTVFNDPAQRQQAVDQLITAATDGAMLFPLVHLPIAAGSFIGDTLRARQASGDAAAFQGLETGAVDSKTRGRSLDAFTSFMRSQTDGTPVENIGVTGEAIRTLYQSHGIEPGAGDGLLGDIIPDLKDQMSQATETGGDIIVPTAAYVAHLAGTPISEALRADIRFRPDGMTMREAGEYEQQRGQMLADLATQGQASADADAARADPVRAIYEDVRSQLRGAGQGADVSDQLARLASERYAARGERLGRDPLELYRSEGVGIQRQMPESLAGITTDESDLVINSLRKDGKQPSGRDLFGPNMHEAVKTAGGIVDTGGELKAVDLDKKPYRGLVRKATGDAADDIHHSADAMALRLWEQGYFPDHAERPSTDDLFEAMRDGENRYMQGAGNERMAAFEEARGDLDQFLMEQGIDVKKASNAEIKAAIQKHLDEERAASGRELMQGEKGKISVGAGKSIITLFKDADASTALHEFGHQWLEELGRDAAAEGAPEGLREDAATAAKYLGAESNVKGFKTAKGSTYEVHEDGSTTRNKAARPDVGHEGQQGPQPKSEATIYVKDPNVLSLIQAKGGDATALAKRADGEWGVKYIEGKNSGKFVRDTLVKDEGGPAVGLTPVEVWKDGTRVHFGNEITEVIKSGGDLSNLTTEQHETFARSFEAYLMEGRAPSAALASVFRNFKSWLVRIYKTVAGLRVPINDEIRGVFDRMVASDEAIESWRNIEGLRPVFADAKTAGMTEAEFTAYSKAIDKARNKADERMLAKTMEAIRKQRTKEWKAEASTVRDEVAPMVKSRPDLKATYFMRTGKMLDDPEAVPSVEKMKLSKSDLHDMYGTDEASKALPSGVVSADGGVHPDEVGELFGYRSGDEMVRALMTLEASKRQAEEATGKDLDGQKYVQHLIDTQVRDTMLDRHGDALNDGSIESEALEAVHNSAQADVMAMETRAIARQAGKVALKLDDIEAWADDQIAGMKVPRGTDQSAFTRLEAKYGKEVQRALLKGDHEAAFIAKQKQLINHVLARKAMEAAADETAAKKMFSRYAGKPAIASMEQPYLDRIHEILKRIGYSTKRSDEELKGGLGTKSLADFVRDKADQGREIAASDFLMDPAWSKASLDEMSVEEMRGVQDTVASLAHVARAESRVLVEDKRVEISELVDEAVEKMSAMPQRSPPAEINPGTAGGIQGVLQRLSSLMRKADAALLKQEQVFDWLDGGDNNGVFNRVVFRRLKDAQNFENDKLREVTAGVRELGQSMPKGWDKALDERKAQPELIDKRTGKPFVFRKKDILALALNTGNDGNFEKLVKGYGWDREGVKAVLDREMKAEDWKFVQGIWDTFESLYPEIEAMTRRVTGVGPDKVHPVPVETRHGTFRGGYYPVVYDPLKSHDAELRAQKAGAAMFENNYFRATTPKGHTIARTAYSAPLQLSLDVIPWKLGQAVHDLAFREAVMDADKFLTQKRIRTAVDNTLGHEYTQQFRKWLQSIANDRNIDDKGLAGMDWLARQARINTTIVGIGFRVSTMLKHGTTALSNSVGEVGGKWMLQGTREVYGSPTQFRQKWDYALDRSGELRHRMNSIDRDVREGLRTIQGQSGMVAAAERYSHYGVAMLDMGSAVPTWYAGYRKALSDGKSDADAVYAGDKAVRNAHGAQGVTDIAQIQRGGEVAKLFTMFYGFFNHIYNRQRDTVRVAGQAVGKVQGGDYAGARRDFAMVLARSIYYVMVPAFVEAMVSGQGPSEDEGWGGWAAKAILGEIPAGIPLVRDIAKAAISGRDYAMSPVAQAVTTGIGTGKDIGSALGLRDKEPSSRWLEHAINTTGYVFGLPTGQAAGSVQYLWDVLDSDEQPDNTADFMHGLMYGRGNKGH